MPGPTQTLSPNGENNNDIIQDNGTIIPFRKHTVRGERSYRVLWPLHGWMSPSFLFKIER
ncbi:Mapre2 [Phodopus roborovskii]|uniref:Mapre2 protein n=1 Tax=Phodopus roborovskii TaxID=109678 RepID=A0AAU9YT45_PHORO|nr:Mapre2 [Phodopus roborovskii]